MRRRGAAAIVVAALISVGASARIALAYDPMPGPSPWGPTDEAGNSNTQNEAKALQAAALIKTGRKWMLAHEYENGMPLLPSNLYVQTLKASVQVNQQVSNLDFFAGDWTQDGTQFDALGHFGYSPMLNVIPLGAVYYNRFTEFDVIALHGLAKLGVDKIKPYFTKGILLDVRRYVNGGAVLGEGQEITVDMALQTLAAQEMTAADIEEGDVVLFVTGWEENWQTSLGSVQATLAYYKGFPGIPGGCPGLGLPLAEWLAAKRVGSVGADNWGVDVAPSPNPPPGITLPVHHELLVKNGIPQLESLKLSGLADALAAEFQTTPPGQRKGVYQFAFVYTPLPIKGGTGSPAAPLAIK